MQEEGEGGREWATCCSFPHLLVLCCVQGEVVKLQDLRNIEITGAITVIVLFFRFDKNPILNRIINKVSKQYLRITSLNSLARKPILGRWCKNYFIERFDINFTLLLTLSSQNTFLLNSVC